MWKEKHLEENGPVFNTKEHQKREPCPGVFSNFLSVCESVCGERRCVCLPGALMPCPTKVLVTWDPRSPCLNGSSLLLKSALSNVNHTLKSWPRDSRFGIYKRESDLLAQLHGMGSCLCEVPEDWVRAGVRDRRASLPCYGEKFPGLWDFNIWTWTFRSLFRYTCYGRGQTYIFHWQFVTLIYYS